MNKGDSLVCLLVYGLPSPDEEPFKNINKMYINYYGMENLIRLKELIGLLGRYYPEPISKPTSTA